MRLDRLPIREVALLLMGNKNAARENLAALSTDYFKVFFISSAVLNRNMPDIVFLNLPNNTRKPFPFNIKPVTRCDLCNISNDFLNLWNTMQN